MVIGLVLQMIMWRDKMKTYFYFLFVLSLLGCTGKDTLVRPHEQKKEEPKLYSLKTNVSEKSEKSIDDMYALLQQLGDDSSAISEKILKPLEQSIVNVTYISNPENTAGNFAEYLNLYTEALLKALKSSNPSPLASGSLDRFVELTLKDCDENLLGCSKIKTFRVSSRSSQLVVLEANKIGKSLDACVEANGVQRCTLLTKRKYYLLLHAKNLSVLIDPNLAFITSYLEHASLVETLPPDSFVRKNHAFIFSTVVQFFDPDQTSTETRCKVVKNFDVWKYSRLSQFGSRQQMIKLFELAGSCDLYDSQNQLTDSFQKAQSDLQLAENNSVVGTTFLRRFQAIQQNGDDKALFLKYLDVGLLERATTVSGDGRLNVSFYDEYFFVLDRLFNRHIGIEEAQTILLKSNRSYRRLIEVFNNYVRMQLVASVIDTKKYMSSLLNQDQETVGSDRVFSNALENSDSFAQTWRSKKDRFEDLFKAVRSVFQTPGLTTSDENKLYEELKLQVRFLPSTIKFIATYPSMMSLAHFVAVQDGEKKARAWWGGDVTYSASTIYEDMWKGQEKPWLNFSAESEPLNKFYLIYAFDYAIRSDFVSIQREEGGVKLSHDEKLQNYARVLVQRYFKSERDALEAMYNNNFLPSVESERLSTPKKAICEYELNPSAQSVPVLNKNLEDIRAQIHSGIGKKSSTNYAASSINFFENAKNLLVQINDKTSVKLKMMKTFIEVMKHNNLPVSVTVEAQAEYDKTNKFVNGLVERFAKDYKLHANCLLRMYLVESFYQYLAFESEKKYLADTWTKMNTLRQLPVEQRDEAMKNINNLPGVYADAGGRVSSNNVDSINFDKIVDEKTFLYSRFDILVRLKNLLMSGKIHDFQTPEIQKVVAGWQKQFPEAMKKPMLIPRQWDIVPPPFLEQSDLINKRDYDIFVYWTPTQDEFVKNGLKALSGVDANSSLIWWSEDNNNELSVWRTALEDLIYIYILQEKTAVNKVSANDLILQMKRMLNLIAINDVDQGLIKSFGYTSKFKIEKNLKDVVVDGGLRETLFPYTFLYENFKMKIGMSADLLDPEQVKKSSAQGAFFADAYILSLNLNNNFYRVYFSSHEWLSPYLQSQYEDISHERLEKIQKMAQAFEENRNFDDAQIVFKMDPDSNKGVRIKDSSRVQLDDNLVHPDRVLDMGKFINKFTLNTKDIYKTSDLGKPKDK